MERRAHVVGTGPGLMHLGVGTQHVVIGQQMGEAKLLDPLGVSADGTSIGADLGLRENDTDLHQRDSAPAA